MKNIITICIIVLPMLSFAQTNTFHIDSCGINTNSNLNQHEINYFNTLVPSEMKFDFTDKQVAFINSNDSTIVLDKQQYFLNYGKAYFYDNNQLDHSIMVLTNEEKARTGFDVVVITLPEAKRTIHTRNSLLEHISH